MKDPIDKFILDHAKAQLKRVMWEVRVNHNNSGLFTFYKVKEADAHDAEREARRLAESDFGWTDVDCFVFDRHKKGLPETIYVFE